MLGVLINRVLLMLLGYAYPAFECYKTVEKNKVDIDELRFWCQYWIVVAILSVLERFGDIFISWLPMYGEAKLALFVYLWYPKVKGTGHVYGALLRPYIAQHEKEIDRALMEVKARAWDYILFNWSHCFKMGQATFFQILQYVAGHTGKATSNSYKESKTRKGDNGSAKEPGAGLSFIKSKQAEAVSKNWPPTPPPSPGRLHRTSSQISTPTRSRLGHSEFEEGSTPRATEPLDSDTLYQTRLKLRRANASN